MEASPSATLALAVYLERPAGPPTESVELREAIHEFFRHRAELSRRRLRELFRRGRTSLVIGLSALGVSFAAGNIVGELFSNHLAGILREGLLIGGWVAMWRPMEIFLYDWWPIRSEASLADRLSVMPVRISYRPDGSTDSWHWDWPVAASATRAVHSEPIESLKAPFRPHDSNMARGGERVLHPSTSRQLNGLSRRDALAGP